nr:DinB family protein [Prevotella sp.]
MTNGILKVVEEEEGVLRNLPIEVITKRRNCQNRTIKQIVGHLIDSASNNQQRMVRLQYSKHLLVFPDYRQDNDLWIALQDYQDEDWNELVSLWKYYNLHIVHLIKAVDNSKLDSYWCDFEGTKVTLKEMIDGYLDHLNLHIKEIHQLIDGVA